jgi:hypothetical protein
LHQVLVAAGLVNEMEANTYTDAERDEIGREVVRLLLSTRGPIAAAACVNPDDCGGDFYLPEGLDPLLVM